MIRSQSETTLGLTRLKAKLMAIVGGLAGGLMLFILTAFSVAINPSASQHLLVLSNYFIGYSVTWLGSLVGLLYGSLIGAAIGYVGSILYGTLAVKAHHTAMPAKRPADSHEAKPGQVRELKRAG